MSFDDASSESRQRFSEVLLLLNHITATGPQGIVTATEIDKAMRGLWLVSLYGAFERSINATVEQSIVEISSHRSPSSACIPSIYSIFHHSRIQSVKDCGYKSVFDKSLALFETASSEDPLNISENPLSEMLQNVDMKTVTRVKSYFGTPTYTVEQENAGRLNNLRERRNAVAHGRESPSQVGARYTYPDLRRIYEIADLESTRFHLHLKDYCAARGYLKSVA